MPRRRKYIGEWTEELIGDIAEGYYDGDVEAILEGLMQRYSQRYRPAAKRDEFEPATMREAFRLWWIMARWNCHKEGMRDGDDLLRKIGVNSMGHDSVGKKAYHSDEFDIEVGEELMSFPGIEDADGNVGIWWIGAEHLYYAPPAVITVGKAPVRLPGEVVPEPLGRPGTPKATKPAKEFAGVREAITEAVADSSGEVVDTTATEKPKRRVIRRKKKD